MSEAEEAGELGILTLVAAGETEAVPFGVPLGLLPLTSLETPEVLDWVEGHRQCRLFVVPGEKFASKGVPSLTVTATTTDYKLVLAELPR